MCCEPPRLFDGDGRSSAFVKPVAVAIMIVDAHDTLDRFGLSTRASPVDTQRRVDRDTVITAPVATSTKAMGNNPDAILLEQILI